MSGITINDEYINELREQFKKWADFLNMGFGLVSFTLALTCLGTKTPVLNAWFSLIVVAFIRYKGSHIFPSEIIRLRKAAKLDQNARIVLNGLSKEFLSVKAMILGYPVFLIGYVLLCIIAVSPLLIPIMPALESYVGF
ncbi:hypothetical protein LH51_15065 [Nitrincola sp. A-D6]|uniref:hypothetical protein n=1 Tax=Nitrincola sp. A-D6 TaxID=1545442 RepID=UPI00051FA38E|nr:hypothetical protein [Nitrincola sp. A-D6]KGK41395.1 hypothetical protein LH51_15065 [Nitrincola sp. A-D6]